MAVLVDQNGNVLAGNKGINHLLSPVTMGHFNISKEANHFMQNGLNESNANDLFQFIPKEMDVYCRQDKNLIPTRASIFKNQPQEGIPETSQTRSNSSQTPHINEGNEVHFFFGGSYVIYFNLNGHHYSLIVQPGDWLYIPSNIEHWIKPTQDNYLIIVSYHSEPFEEFHTKVTYTKNVSKAFL